MTSTTIKERKSGNDFSGEKSVNERAVCLRLLAYNVFLLESPTNGLELRTVVQPVDDLATLSQVKHTNKWTKMRR